MMAAGNAECSFVECRTPEGLRMFIPHARLMAIRETKGADDIEAQIAKYARECGHDSTGACFVYLDDGSGHYLCGDAEEVARRFGFIMKPQPVKEETPT